MPTNPIPTTMPEAIFAAAQEIPMSRLRQWRKEGDLIEGQHWHKSGQAYHLTAEGQSRVLELSGLPVSRDAQQATATATVKVNRCRPGVQARVIRAHRMDTGSVVSVLLTAPNVFASQFRASDQIDVTPTATEGIFEYAGRRPMRIRL